MRLRCGVSQNGRCPRRGMVCVDQAFQALWGKACVRLAPCRTPGVPLFPSHFSPYCAHRHSWEPCALLLFAPPWNSSTENGILTALFCCHPVLTHPERISTHEKTFHVFKSVGRNTDESKPQIRRRHGPSKFGSFRINESTNWALVIPGRVIGVTPT